MEKKTRVRASVIIDASPQKVWEVLTDFDNLKRWSSSFQGLSGDFKKNGAIEVTFKSPFGQSKMKKKLFQFEERKSFGWTGVFMLGMSDYHTHTLKPTTNGKTEFIQTDGLSGGASFLLGRMLEKQMQKGYEVFNKELKTFVESKNKQFDE